jgi:ABC-type glycerol-3-phosphate transport system substrate-binding protein
VLDTSLALYGAAGGAADGLPDPNSQAAAQMLTFLAEARAEGSVIAAGEPSLRAAWNRFLSSDAAATAVAGTTFIGQQANFPGLRWGPLPGPDGPAPPVAWGWALAVPVPAADRATRAGRLAAWLTDPAHRGWIAEARLLPAWPEDLETAPEHIEPPPAPGYLTFLAEALDTARPVPAGEDWTTAWNAALAAALGADGTAAP